MKPSPEIHQPQDVDADRRSNSRNQADSSIAALLVLLRFTMMPSLRAHRTFEHPHRPSRRQYRATADLIRLDLGESPAALNCAARLRSVAAEYLQQTIDGLKAFIADFVIPMQSSGEAFISPAQVQLGPKFVRSSTGTRFVFAA